MLHRSKRIHSMTSPFDPLQMGTAWTKFAIAYTQMSVAASEVVLRRTLKMAQGGMTAGEAVGMVMEKATAFVAATEGAAVAAAAGGDALGIASAALRPIRAKTRSNARKLRG
jgi:hypothetical protein